MGLLIFLIVLALLIYIFQKSVQKYVVVEKGGEVRTVRKLNLPLYKLAVITLVLLILGLIAVSIRYVPVGHAMVKFNIVTKKFSVSKEGITLVLPIVYNTYIYDLRRQEYTMTSKKGEGKKPNIDDSLWAPTSEGLQVGIDITTWYRVNPDKLVYIHRKIGPDYAEKIVRPTIRSVVRLVISEYKVMDVYSAKRRVIQNEIEDRIKKILEPDGFIIDGVVLRDVHFTPGFAKAIEEKQIAQQEAERMNYVLLKEQKEAERKKIEAQGEAKKIGIVSKALNQNPKYLKYLYISKLSDKVKVIVADQPTILDLKDILSK